MSISMLVDSDTCFLVWLCSYTIRITPDGFHVHVGQSTPLLAFPQSWVSFVNVS